MDARLLQLTVKDYVGGRDQQQLFLGPGAATLQSGTRYEGDWCAGKMHGSGDLHFPDGITYTGDMQHNTITGVGVYCWPEGTYEGEVASGRRHGQGVMRLAGSEAVYEGAWEHGQRQGQGVLNFNSNRTAYYEGAWAGDQKEGQGIMVYPSGNTYTGSWAADLKAGEGIMVWASSGQVYRGSWGSNQQEGLGLHQWLDTQLLSSGGAATHLMCNKYLGLFHAGRRHGEGSLFSSTGARYEGEWRADKKHGAGVYLFEDGTLFLGRFDQDRPLLDQGCFVTAAGVEPALVAAASGLAAAEPSVVSVAAGGASGGGGPVGGAAAPSPPASATPSTRNAAAAAAGGKGKPTATAAAKQEGASGATSRARSPAVAAGAAGLTGSLSATGSRAGSAAAAAGGRASIGGAAGSSRGGSAGGAPDPAAAATAAPQPPPPPAKSFVSTAPGFGPRQTALQLYIGDVLKREANPAGSGKQVLNLLVGYNTQLRLLYDQYRRQPSVFLSAAGLHPAAAFTVDSAVQGPAATSRALRAAQVWSLALEGGLVSRHLSMADVDAAVAAAAQPPPVVRLRRQQVARTAAAAAVLQDAAPPHDPTREVLYRDFCELLVRLAAVRFPQLATLEQRLQMLLTQYLLPLLAVVPAALDSTPRSVAAAVAGGMASGGGAHAANLQQQQQQQQQQHPLLRQSLSEDASNLLLDHWQLVEALFDRVSVKGLTGDAARSAAEQLYCQQEEMRYKSQVEAMLGPGCWTSYEAMAAVDAAAAASPDQDPQQQQQQFAETATSSGSGSGGVYEAATSARRMLECWSAAGVVPAVMGPVELLQVLLEPFLTSNDPEPPRLRLDAELSEGPADLDSKASTSGATAAADHHTPSTEGGADGGVAADQQEQPAAANPPAELLFWADAPLTFADFVLGLLRVGQAAMLREHGAATAAAAEAGAPLPEPLVVTGGAGQVAALQQLLLGEAGLFHQVLGWVPPPPPAAVEEEGQGQEAAEAGDGQEGEQQADGEQGQYSEEYDA